MKCQKCEKDKTTNEFRQRVGHTVSTCKDCEKSYQREYYARNRDVMRRRKREGMAKLRASDPAKARRKQREWHSANRAQNTLKMRQYNRRRFFWSKAMKLKGAGRADYKQLASLWKSQKGLCALTGRRLDRTAQLDHRIPKARGGGDEIENLQWLCKVANLAKRDLTDEEFTNLCSTVMRWIGERIQLVEDLFPA